MEEGEELSPSEETAAEDSSPIMPETISEMEEQPAQTRRTAAKKTVKVKCRIFFINSCTSGSEDNLIITVRLPFV